jgi:hypothetical protein
LDRLGIKPGGIDEAAAEPPPPADRQRFERQETDEIVGSDQEAVNDDDPVPELGRLNADGRYPRRVDAASRGEVPILAQEASFNLEEYVPMRAQPGRTRGP